MGELFERLRRVHPGVASVGKTLACTALQVAAACTDTFLDLFFLEAHLHITISTKFKMPSDTDTTVGLVLLNVFSSEV